MELDSFYYNTWFEMGRSDITVVSISVDPNKSYKRGNFLRNCGTAFVGEYRKVIWYHQLRWLPNKSCLSSNIYGLQTLKYGWKAPAALSMTIFKAVKRMTTWNLLETGRFLKSLKVKRVRNTHAEMPTSWDLKISSGVTFEPFWFDPQSHRETLMAAPPHEVVL